MNTTPEMGFNWESEKRRLLAALESDFDPRDPTARAERVRIEDVLRSTELAIDEKDREIEHWKKRCEELECQAAEQPDAAEARPTARRRRGYSARARGSGNWTTSCRRNSGWPKLSCRWNGRSWPASRSSWKRLCALPTTPPQPIPPGRPIANFPAPADAGWPDWD